MTHARTKTPTPSSRASSSSTNRPAATKKVAITVRLDAAQAERLQAVAAADNRTLTNYVETALARDLAMRDEAARVITMFVAPGVSTSIDPAEVIRAECETDDAYQLRQALAVELWSIPHNA